MSKILHPFQDNATVSTSIESNSLDKKELPDSLVITIDATHAGYRNRNCFFYDTESMKYAVKKDIWTKPYAKPLLKNHDMESEPLGRVVTSRFIETEDGKGFTQLDVKVTDKEAIEKIMDGRYLTVSTSGVPMKDASSQYNFTICSICGTNLNSDDFCGHSRGRVYEDDDGIMKMCFWRVGAIDYKEVSVVNTPADNDGNTAAQITNIAMIDGEEEVDLSQVDTTISKSNITVFADNEVDYTDTVDFEESQVANKDLWKSVGQDKQKYIDNNGLIFNKVSKEKVVDKVSNWTYDENSKTYKDKEGNHWKEVDHDLLAKIVDSSDETSDAHIETIPSWRAEHVKLTDSTKGGYNYPHHHAVYYDDELGNGTTDYILGHSHKVIDNKIQTGVVEHTGKTHNHKISDENVSIGITKKLLDKEKGHRHSVYVNEAGNGWSSFVDGHSHLVVNGMVIGDGSSELHIHDLVEWPKSEMDDVSEEGAFITIKDLQYLLDNIDSLDIENKDNLKEYLENTLNDYNCLDKASEQVQVDKLLSAISNCS